MDEGKAIVAGRYRHYKGREYTVLGTARHSETMEELVVYRQEYGEYGLWVRPKQMFAETVTVAGQTLDRFAPLSDCRPELPLSVPNLYGEIPQSMPVEVMQTILQADTVRIERIVSRGHHSPPDYWYEQAQHEWVIVLSGAARLQFDDRTLDMHPGDYVNIPAFSRHRVAWTAPDEPTVWLAVWYGQQA